MTRKKLSPEEWQARKLVKEFEEKKHREKQQDDDEWFQLELFGESDEVPD